MATKYHYGTGIVSAVLGVLGGLLVRKSQEKRDIDAEARARGFIKPEECPPPCLPLNEITDQDQCLRCGGVWIPSSGPYGRGECVPRSGGGSGASGGTLPPPLQPGPQGGGPTTIIRTGGGSTPGTPSKGGQPPVPAHIAIG